MTVHASEAEIYHTYVREHLQRLGLSMREGAALTGIPLCTLFRHQRDHNWRWKQLVAITVGLDIPLDRYLRGLRARFEEAVGTP